MKNSIELSRMDCYAGKYKVEVMEFTKPIHDSPGLYLQFVEGCGYSPYELTPDEADQLADLLNAQANATRKAFGIKKK